jgi:hypothetical protein
VKKKGGGERTVARRASWKKKKAKREIRIAGLFHGVPQGKFG